MKTRSGFRGFLWIAAATIAACSPAALPVSDAVPASHASRGLASIGHVPVETPIHFFNGTPDGELPAVGHLTQDAAGNLFGTTNSGGTGKCSFQGTRTGCGTVFEMQRSPSGGWSERVIYSFKNLADGAAPYATLAMDGAGDLFGVTMAGGNRGCVALFWIFRGCGTAFELTPSGNKTWTKTTLHVFQGGADGGNPASGLVLGTGGILYGATVCGGIASCYASGSGVGVFFQLSKNSSDRWSETTLHAFGSKRGDSAYPRGDLTAVGQSVIYGATVGGVYEMSRSSTSSRWLENSLFLFPYNRMSQGYLPNGGLVLDRTGNFYGTTWGGGNFKGTTCDEGCGVVFELSRSPSGWRETLLHVFSGSDGAHDNAGLAMDANGQLFGTTGNGGNLSCNNGGGCGVVYSLRPHGMNSPFKVMHSFEDNASDGGMPQSAVILNRAGELFGTTQYGGRGPNLGKGTVFEVTH